MKPVAGVMPLWDEERDSIWMLPGYLDGLRSAGAVPVILPMTADAEELEQLADLCGGFLLTGGHDVTPALYGEEPLEGLVSCCPERDAMEAEILRIALERDLPVLGICRGIQFLNAWLGGTLYQDLPTQHPSGTEHHQAPPYDLPCHEVMLTEGAPLRGLLGTDRLAVNSYHHQAVRTVAPGLKPMAVSPDGLTEAVYLPGRRFVWAVQWHPEFSHETDEHSRKLFRAFVRAMEERGTDL